MPVTTTDKWCPRCRARHDHEPTSAGRCRRCGETVEVRVLVHYSRCGDPERLGCKCPPGWPRRPEDVAVMHRWSGNCTRTGAATCDLHDQPRGACSICAPCPACQVGVTY